MYECKKCEQFGLSFQRDYSPEEYIEGNRNSQIWIVGLNPALDPSWIDGVDNRLTSELQEYFDTEDKIHSYFKDFRSVSPKLFCSLGQQGGTAHVDLVKCPSKSWPPNNAKGKEEKKIIENCEVHLIAQIRQIRPMMIICNGASVCTAVKKIFPLPLDCSPDVTSYFTQLDGERICIVLSGFIGRIDNYARRRLGYEIETRLNELGL